jgi:two-component system, OmpR family, response regulator RegX3
LVARIRAVQRRTGPATPILRPVQRFGPLEIDRAWRAGGPRRHEVDLTPKEFDLLAFLAEEPGMVRNRGSIIAQVWDEHWWGHIGGDGPRPSTCTLRHCDASWAGWG